VISKLALVLDIYSSLSLIWRYSYCLVFQGATSYFRLCLLHYNIAKNTPENITEVIIHYLRRMPENISMSAHK
ncbi:MAG: hypothetical protein E6932_11810, partial [Citrobacter freundii]|nr:hypothetical protein [Citrobacter freundii]